MQQQLFRRIEEISKELGIEPPYPLSLKLRISDRDGRVVMDRREPAHSWTRNGWNMMMAFYGDAGASGASFGAGYLTSKDTSGNIGSAASRCIDNSYVANTDRGSFICNANESGYGMVVGTGATAFNVNQYALATLIAHGSGSGQLYYGVMSQSVRIYGDAEKYWSASFARTFHNYDTASIVVREIGIYWRGYLFTDILRTYLVARDVLATPLTVDYGDTLTAYYYVRVDYSEID